MKEINYDLNKDVELFRLGTIKSDVDCEVNRFLDVGIELKTEMTDNEILDIARDANLQGVYVIGKTPCMCIHKKDKRRRVLLRPPRTDFERIKASASKEIDYVLDTVEIEHKQNEFVDILKEQLDSIEPNVVESYIKNNDLFILQEIGLA